MGFKLIILVLGLLIFCGLGFSQDLYGPVLTKHTPKDGATNNPFIDSFSIILLPDTQYYSLNYPDLYDKQAKWIKDNLSHRNIKFVIHLGDITDKNDPFEWHEASDAHKIIDGIVPYTLAPGNHDIYPKQLCYLRDYTNLNFYFPPARFVGSGGCFEGSQNNYTYFEHDDLKFLVISLEITPRKKALDWANSVIEDHPLHRVIVVTHAYQNKDGSYNLTCDASYSDGYYNLIGSDGEELWDEFVSRHSNIFMVLSGHVNGSIRRARSDTSFKNTVHEILTDYQEEPSGGNGWLRVLTFNRGLGVSEVRSEVLSVRHSVKLLTQTDDYPADPAHVQHAFYFDYDMITPMSPNRYDDSNIKFGDMTVNSTSTGDQVDPQVAMGADGNYVVVWDDSVNNDIYVRGFKKGGWARFSQFRVNSISNGNQGRPSIAMNGKGDFVVVWEDDQDGNGKYEIFARGFYADGAERFSDMTVNSISAEQQRNPDVAIDDYGNFVVVWEDDQDGNGTYQIYARGFYANGKERFSDKTVNSVASGQQLNPQVAMQSQGHFFVVWEDDNDMDQVFDILARGFYNNGVERFPDMMVSSVSSWQQLNPDVAADAVGHFVVVWEDDKDENGKYQIFARGFYPNGTLRHPEMTVNSVNTGQQLEPNIAMDDNGLFIVTWEDDKDENGYFEIYARGFYSDCSERFPDMNVNGNEDNQQFAPSAAMATNGCCVVVWEDDLDGNGSWQVLARGL